MTGEVIENKNRISLNKDLFKLFLPLVIEQGLEYIVGMADSIMVAQVGEAAVSGVSLVDFIMALLISIFAALATGGAVIAGQYFGKKDISKAKGTGRQLLKISVWFSVFIMITVYMVKPLIFKYMFGGISTEVQKATNIYFLIVLPSIPFLALYNSGAAIFRTTGNSKLPMQIMLSMNILNVIGNGILVIIFHMGVAGVAIPTLVSRIGAAIIILYLANKKEMKLSIKGWMKTKFDREIIKQILNIGMPFGFENGMFYLGRLVVLSVVASFGTASIAANSVGGTIVMFEVLPEMAINLGLSVIVSRVYGMGDYEQLKYYNRKIIRIIHGTFIVSTLIVLGIMPLIMKVYNLSPEATEMAWLIVISHGVLMILIWPAAHSLPVIFRGVGNAKFPMIVSMTSMILCRIVLAYVFAFGFGMGMIGTWVAMFFDWVVKAIIFGVYYLKNMWIKIKK